MKYIIGYTDGTEEYRLIKSNFEIRYLIETKKVSWYRKIKK